MGSAPLHAPRRRYLRWAAGLALLFVAALAALVYWRLPLAEMALHAGLAYGGVDGAAFKVERLDGEGATVTGLRAGSAVQIGSLRVAWNRHDPFHRPLDTVTIVGGRLDFAGESAAFWSRLMAQRSGSRGPATLARLIPHLPAIDVQRVTVRLPAPHGAEELAVDATFRPQDGGAHLLLGARTAVDGAALDAAVTLSGLVSAPSLSLRATVMAPLDSIARRVSGGLPLAGRARIELAAATPVALAESPLRSPRDVLALIGSPSLDATVFLDGVRWGDKATDMDGRADMVLSVGADGSPRAHGRVRLGVARVAVAAGAAADVHVEGALSAQLVDGVLALDLQAPLVITAARATAGRVALGPLSLSVAAAGSTALRLDLAADPLRGASAALAVSSQPVAIHLDDDPVPVAPPLAVAGTIRVAHGAARFRGQVTSLGGRLAVAVDARHDLNRGRGQAHVTVEPLRLGPAGVELRQLAPALGRLSATAGTLGGVFDLAWDGKGPGGTGRVRIDGLDLADTASGFSATGLSGSLAFNRLPSPVTPPGQELRLARLDAGVLLQDIALRFQVVADTTGAPAVAVDSLTTAIAGGRLSVSGGRIGAGGDGSVPLRLTAVDMATVFGLVGVEGLGGTGTVDGMIPITVAAGRLSVAAGRLAARGPGRLRLRSAAVRQALAGAGQEVTWMLQALEDFRYDRLSLAIEKAPEGIARLRLETLGSNPAVLQGRQFAINLNLEADVDRIAAALVEALRLPGRLVGTIVRGSR